MHLPQVAPQPPMLLEQPAPAATAIPYDPQGPAASWLGIVNPALAAGVPVGAADINEALAMALAQNDGPAVAQLVLHYNAPPLQLPPWFLENATTDDVRRQLAELAEQADDAASPERAHVAGHLLANPLYAQASLLRGPDGRTPLMVAASNPRSAEMLRAFVGVPGASPNLRTPTAENALSLTLHAHGGIANLPVTRAKVALLIDADVKVNTTEYAPGEMPVDDLEAEAAVGNDIHPVTLASLKNLPNDIIWRLTNGSLMTGRPGFYSQFERPELVAPGETMTTDIRCAMEDLVTRLTDPQVRWLMEQEAAFVSDDFPLDMASVIAACNAGHFERAALLLAGALTEDTPLSLVINELQLRRDFFNGAAVDLAQAAVNLAQSHPLRWNGPMAGVLALIMVTAGVTLHPDTGTPIHFTTTGIVDLNHALQAEQEDEVPPNLGGGPPPLTRQQLMLNALDLVPVYLSNLEQDPVGAEGMQEDAESDPGSPQPL